MVAQAAPEGNQVERKDEPLRRWIEPPWNEASPEWLAIDAQLPADDVARKIDRAVEMFLNLDRFERSYACRGYRGFPPRLLLKVVLYAKHRGWNQPSQWYDAARHHRVCQWLTRGLCPSRSRWYAFRRRIAPWVEAWNAQVLSIAVQAQVTPATRGVQDGTLIAANATRHKLVGPKKINERWAALTQAVASEAAAAVPAASSPSEPARAPAASSGAWMAKTPRGRRQQLRRYQALAAAMQAREAENRQRPASERKPPEKLRLSPGDPAAALGLDKQRVFRPLYNVQLIDDLDSPLILAYGVFARSSDNGTSEPMVACHRRLTGVGLEVSLVDAKYTTPADLAVYGRTGVTVYGYTQEEVDASRKTAAGRASRRQIPKSAFVWLEAEGQYQCPAGRRLSQRRTRKKACAGGQTVCTMIYACAASDYLSCAGRAECTPHGKRGREIRRSEHEELIEALASRMREPESQALYRRRSQTVELAFADVKQHRNLTRFSGHGLNVASAEVGLGVLAHNILTLLDALDGPVPPPRPPPNP
jgi:hypothetical protein